MCRAGFKRNMLQSELSAGWIRDSDKLLETSRYLRHSHVELIIKIISDCIFRAMQFHTWNGNLHYIFLLLLLLCNIVIFPNIYNSFFSKSSEYTQMSLIFLRVHILDSFFIPLDLYCTVWRWVNAQKFRCDVH